MPSHLIPVRMLTSIAWARRSAAAGDVVELPPDEAARLVASGLAVREAAATAGAPETAMRTPARARGAAAHVGRP